MTIEVPQSLKDRLEALSVLAHRSPTALVRDAISLFVETEEDYFASLSAADAEIDQGLGLPHDEAMRRLRAYCETRPPKLEA